MKNEDKEYAKGYNAGVADGLHSGFVIALKFVDILLNRHSHTFIKRILHRNLFGVNELWHKITVDEAKKVVSEYVNLQFKVGDVVKTSHGYGIVTGVTSTDVCVMNVYGVCDEVNKLDVKPSDKRIPELIQVFGRLRYFENLAYHECGDDYE